ncbi:MAG: hypothetical protein LBR00_00470 [Clostridiales Family XIII bacterium]|jgi:hypothetical protein|nr:hypothetical protein [Clostridiales Family XIII bacterium]
MGERMRINKWIIVLIVLIAAVAVYAAIVMTGSGRLYRNGSGTTDLADAMMEYVDNHEQDGYATLNIAEFTNFDWDRMLAFCPQTSSQEVEIALGVKYSKSLDLTSGIIFTKGSEIVYEEMFAMYPDDGDIDMAPIFSILPQNGAFQVFDKSIAIFRCERIYTGSGVDYRYYLTPISEQ